MQSESHIFAFLHTERITMSSFAERYRQRLRQQQESGTSRLPGNPLKGSTTQRKKVRNRTGSIKKNDPMDEAPWATLYDEPDLVGILKGESLKVPRRKGSVKGEVKVPRRRGSLEGADEYDFSRKRTTSVQPPSAVARTGRSEAAQSMSTGRETMSFGERRWLINSQSYEYKYLSL